MLFRTFVPPALAVSLLLGLTATAEAASSCLGGPSTTLRLAGPAIATPKTFTPASLAAYPPSKVTVSYFSGASGMVTKTFVGVPLYDLVQAAGLVVDANRKNDKLRKYLAATATDCYQAILSYAEIDPGYGGQQAMVAYATVDATGTQTPLDDTEGAMKLVIPGDKFGGRQVFHLESLTARSAP